MRVPTFRTHYITCGGILMVLSDDYVVLVRIRDGMCERFTYEQLGF
jgi:hypothetical protein